MHTYIHKYVCISKASKDCIADAVATTKSMQSNYTHIHTHIQPCNTYIHRARLSLDNASRLCDKLSERWVAQQTAVAAAVTAAAVGNRSQAHRHKQAHAHTRTNAYMHTYIHIYTQAHKYMLAGRPDSWSICTSQQRRMFFTCIWGECKSKRR